jgi:hypothetical protein
LRLIQETHKKSAMKPIDRTKLAEYVKYMADMNDLPIAPEYEAGVVANLAKITEIYQVVPDFTLPDNIEPAPTFDPDGR